MRVEEYSLVGWDSIVAGHRQDLMVQKHTGHIDLVVSTHIDLEERRKFLDSLAMERDPSYKLLGLVEDWRCNCLEADLSLEARIVELDPSSLEVMAEDD
jgi:hypothetical protein